MRKARIAVEEIARICHTANKAYCEALGDSSQPSWEDAPDWQKESCIEGVEFYLKNNQPMAQEDSHNNWMTKKLKEGWRYGEVKDVEKKEHPCLLPYNSLPDDQKAKDGVFTGIVAALSDFHFDNALNEVALPAYEAGTR